VLGHGHAKVVGALDEIRREHGACNPAHAMGGAMAPLHLERVSQLERFADGATVDEARPRSASRSGAQRAHQSSRPASSRKLTVHAHGFSAKAAEKIEQAKGKAVVIADKVAATSPKI
jgi:hypothetical protein